MQRLFALVLVHTGCAAGQSPPPAVAPDEFVEAAAEYLGARWILTSERPTVILCASLGVGTGEEAVGKLTRVVDRVVASIIVEPDCGSLTSSGPNVILKIREIVVDSLDARKGEIRAHSDNPKGYYISEVMRYHRSTGAVISIDFGGFEHYVPIRPGDG